MKAAFTFWLLLISAGIVWMEIAASPLPPNAKATSIVVEKSKHLMTVYSHNVVLRTYHVSLGRSDSAAKQQEGDNRTPEGHYIIDAKNAQSPYYKSLHISYPSVDDLVRAKAQGVSPGGAVMIHGLRNDLKWLGPLHRFKDWTRGCVAVTDTEMDEIWQMVDVGTPIEIRS